MIDESIRAVKVLAERIAAAPRLMRWLHGAKDLRMEARAERILVVAGVVIRGTFVLQILVAMFPEGPLAMRPGLFYALSIVMVAESLVLVVYMLRQGRYITWAAVVDLVFVAGLVVVQPLSVRPADMVGTWVGWGYGATFAAVIPAAIAVRWWRIVILGTAMMMAAYLLGTLPHPISENARVTALTNALSIVGLGVACRLAGGFVRLMGQEADRARDRERTLLHNYAPVLHLLSREIPDRALKESAMGAAARGARQIRAALSDHTALPLGTNRGRHHLRAMIDGVCEEFADLPLTANLELLGATAVKREVSDAVADAIRTLLWNVRRHAHATSVTVHGDCDDGGVWTVTVTDNGVGFDTTATDRGWGLRVQAGSALAEAEVNIRICSAPGEGTRVQLRPMTAQDRRQS